MAEQLRAAIELLQVQEGHSKGDLHHQQDADRIGRVSKGSIISFVK